MSAKNEAGRWTIVAMTPLEALGVAERLRRHAIALKPGWPDEEERAADLAHHARVSEALRAVSPRHSR